MQSLSSSVSLALQVIAPMSFVSSNAITNVDTISFEKDSTPKMETLGFAQIRGFVRDESSLTCRRDRDRRRNFHDRFGYFRGSKSSVVDNHDWVADCLRSGRSVCNSHWGAAEIRRAQHYLTCTTSSPGGPLKVSSLFLPQNSFEDSVFHQLMELLANREEFKRLRVTVRKVDDLEVIVNTFDTGSLANIELDLRFSITQRHSILLSRLVKIPTKSLILIFYPGPHNNYLDALVALESGTQAINGEDCCLPEVHFRNVIISDQAAHIPSSFASLVCKSNLLKGLEVFPYATASHICDFMLQLMPLLAEASSLAELQISPCVLMQQKDRVAEKRLAIALKTALARNTNLRSLSLHHDIRFAALLQEAIFPALTVNRHLESLDLGDAHDASVVQSFLNFLPSMKGIRHVTAPWHAGLGQQWIDTLQRVETLWSVDFALSDYWGDRLTVNEKSDIQTIASLGRRNHQLHLARRFCQNVARESPLRRVPRVISAIETLGADDTGLSGVFVIVQSSLDIFLV